jgi:hypothetical protein
MICGSTGTLSIWCVLPSDQLARGSAAVGLLPAFGATGGSRFTFAAGHVAYGFRSLLRPRGLRRRFRGIFLVGRRYDGCLGF